MNWQRLTAGDRATCRCGTVRFHVEPGTVTWWVERPANMLPPRSCNRHSCGHLACGRVFWAVTVDADLASSPPQLTPLPRAG